jgi:hypothetical protein
MKINGHVVTIERAGSLVTGSAIAPFGKVWVANGLHELCSTSRGGKEARQDVINDLRERIAYGMRDCADSKCEWAHNEEDL